MNKQSQKKSRVAMALALCTALAACGDGSNSRPSRVTPAPAVTLEEKLQGNWEQRGYGRLIRITDLDIATFDFTAETCMLINVDSVDDFSGVVLSDNETTFTLRETELAFATQYTRLAAFPTVCETPLANTPTNIYRHVWHSFDELYAFFELRGVDWLAQFDATRDLVNDEMTGAELLEVLVSLLSPFDDEHVLLETGDQTFNPANPKGFMLQLITEYEAQSEIEALDKYILSEIGRWDAIIREGYLSGSVTSAGDDTFIWGVIGDEVGYLRIDAMIFNLDDAIDEQVDKAENILDEVFTDLAHTRSMIVDVRLNGGGADPFAMAVARRFMDTERLVISKFTHTSGEDGPLQDLHLNPTNRPAYLKPVALITSGFTTSAAESFTLAMRAIPQVTHLGETTNGALSDVLSKPLPNGWQVELSNEVYLDHQGRRFEAIGIPPELEAPVFRLLERTMGQDSGLNAALLLLGDDSGIAPGL